MARAVCVLAVALAGPAWAHGPADQADIFRSALAHYGVSCLGHDLAQAKLAADGLGVAQTWAAVDALAFETGTLARHLRRQTEEHATAYRTAIEADDAETLADAARHCGEMPMLRRAIADEARDHAAR